MSSYHQLQSNRSALCLASALILLAVTTSSCGKESPWQSPAPAVGEETEDTQNPLTLAPSSGPKARDFLVGAASADITGPAAGLATGGYAAPAPETAGIHQRLRARAFVIAERANPLRRVVLVTADLCYITGILKAEVVRELEKIHGSQYGHQNVLIAATHTHSAPAGFSQHLMYNIPSGGFSEENFRIISQGIVRAISDAHLTMEPASIDLVAGSISGGARNRSLAAFLRNPAELRAELPNSVDETVTMLRMETENGPLGIQHWFATHGTSMTKINTLISPDNKGYAAWRFEKKMRDDAYSTGHFVAAFANSNGGDASPNIAGDIDGDGDWECGTGSDFDCTREIGHKQYDSAVELLARPGRALSGQIRSTLRFVDMPSIRLPAEVTGEESEVEICRPAVGLAMLAGSSEDGPGVGSEGVNCESDSMLADWRCSQEEFKCHGNKPVVYWTDEGGRYGLTPRMVPVQLITIGSLAIAGLPAEITSMAGHKLRKSIHEEMVDSGVERVVIAAYSNEYSNYVTTREEYQAQHYEGGATLFGEWTLTAYQTLFRGLAEDLATGRELVSGEVPDITAAPILHAKPLWSSDSASSETPYGHVLADVKPIYRPGETVKVSFRGSNPNNDLRLGGTFFEVQKLENNAWRRVADDDDFDTRLRWSRNWLMQSRFDVEWDLPLDAPAGRYRIELRATAADIFRGRTTYSGTSSVFDLKGM
jgi:neutral ceramidase